MRSVHRIEGVLTTIAWSANIGKGNFLINILVSVNVTNEPNTSGFARVASSKQTHSDEESYTLSSQGAELIFKALACWLLTEISPHDEAAGKSRRHGIPVALPAVRYTNTFSADKSLPLKHEYFLFSDQKDWCAAGRNRHCIRERLFATVRCGASLQSLHGGEMDLCNAMKRRCPLWGTDYFARYNFCLAVKLLDGHGHMFVLIYALEGFDVFGTRIDHDQRNVTHLTLLEVKCLYP